MSGRFGSDIRDLRHPAGLALAVVLLATSGAARAQDVSDGDTLPKHVGGFIIRPGFLLGGGGERFGPGGWTTSRESFLADFDNINLAEVLAGNNAGTLQTLLGDLGTTRFQATQTGIGVTLMSAYGITDRWTVAAYLPFQYSTYEFDAWLAPSPPRADGSTLEPSHYAVRDPKAIQCPGGQFRLDNPADLTDKLLELRSNYNFNIGDLNRAFVSDCLGYDAPIKDTFIGGDGLVHGRATRTEYGFRDLILGTKYKFFHGRHLQLAAIGYVVAPTGKTESPNDLFNVRFGDGTWNAATLLGVTVPLDQFRIFGSVGYEHVFEDTSTRRVKALNFSDDLEQKLAKQEITEAQLYDEHLDDGSVVQIVTKYDTAQVHRKLGDNVYVYSGLSYDVFEWLNVGVRFDFWHHFRDEILDIGQRLDNTPAYKSEATIRAEVDQLVAAGTVTEDRDAAATAECFRLETNNCKTKELVVRLRDSEGRRKASYGWHTVRGQLIGGIAVGFNTLGPFLRGEFPLPIIAAISYSRFLAGTNIDVTDQAGFSLVIPIPFGDVKDPAEYGFDDDPEPDKGLPFP